MTHSAVRVVLLDIEGTTTPLSFVHQVLFPYAHAHVEDFLIKHFPSENVRADLAQLFEEHAADTRAGLTPPPLQNEQTETRIKSIVAYIHWLMDRDRKSTPLKSLQGKIWEEGYRSGALRSEVFADVPPALERWRRQEKEICIFSSGSIMAQRLLFAHTSAGDLTKFIREYFDTTTGAKTGPESYRKIARHLDMPASDILFVSDVTTELDAGRSAGMHTLLSVRPGNHPQPMSKHEVIRTFEELFL